MGDHNYSPCVGAVDQLFLLNPNMQEQELVELRVLAASAEDEGPTKKLLTLVLSLSDPQQQAFLDNLRDQIETLTLDIDKRELSSAEPGLRTTLRKLPTFAEQQKKAKGRNRGRAVEELEHFLAGKDAPRPNYRQDGNAFFAAFFGSETQRGVFGDPARQDKYRHGEMVADTPASFARPGPSHGFGSVGVGSFPTGISSTQGTGNGGLNMDKASAGEPEGLNTVKDHIGGGIMGAPDTGLNRLQPSPYAASTDPAFTRLLSRLSAGLTVPDHVRMSFPRLSQTRNSHPRFARSSSCNSLTASLSASLVSTISTVSSFGGAERSSRPTRPSSSPFSTTPFSMVAVF